MSLRLPKGLEDVSTVPKLVAELLKRGWKDEEVRLALGKNLIRVLNAAEAVRRRHRHTHAEPQILNRHIMQS